MLRREVEHDFVARVKQKRWAALHRFENTRFPFDTQINLKSFRLRHKSH